MAGTATHAGATLPDDLPAPRRRRLILYSTPDGAVRFEVVFEDETFWLTQKKMAELFGVTSEPSMST